MAIAPHLLKALTRHDLLSGVGDDVLQRIAGHMRWLDARPKQVIAEFEDVTTDVFLILQGRVRVLVHTADGARTQILGDFTSGDLVGEMAAIDGVSRSAQIETLVQTRLCILPASAFLDLVLSCPHVSLRLFRLLTARLRAQNSRLLEQSVLPSRLRLVAELLRLGRIRHDGALVVSPPPTHEELAARIGLRRETVCRDMSSLTRAGLVQCNRAAIVAVCPATLRKVVNAAMADRISSCTASSKSVPK